MEKQSPVIFEYSIFWLPTTEQEKEGKKPKILVDVKRILSLDEKSAFMLASRDIPDEYATSDQLDQVQIAIRPF